EPTTKEASCSVPSARGRKLRQRAREDCSAKVPRSQLRTFRVGSGPTAAPRMDLCALHFERARKLGEADSTRCGWGGVPAFNAAPGGSGLRPRHELVVTTIFTVHQH